MAKNPRMAKFNRVTALFEQGKEVVLEEGGPDGPVLVWVAKLNPFEQEDARKDGNTGRARATLLLDDQDSPEMAVFQEALSGRTTEAIVDALVAAKQNEDYVMALDDLRALEEWQEKLLVLDAGDQQILDAGRELTAEESEVLAKLNQEYNAKVSELLDSRQDDRRKELTSLSEKEVRDAYRDAYRDTVGSQGFLTEYKTSEMYYALRDCHATVKDDNGRWKHDECANHRDRLCLSRADVRDLPEGLISLVTQAIRELTMSPKDAGNSDAPASSSASSEPRSEAAESSPSTPEEMSPVPAGT